MPTAYGPARWTAGKRRSQHGPAASQQPSQTLRPAQCQSATAPALRTRPRPLVSARIPAVVSSWLSSTLMCIRSPRFGESLNTKASRPCFSLPVFAVNRTLWCLTFARTTKRTTPDDGPAMCMISLWPCSVSLTWSFALECAGGCSLGFCVWSPWPIDPVFSLGGGLLLGLVAGTVMAMVAASA